MATIYIDGKPYEVKDGQNLLEACLTLGFNLPFFCWHPALGAVGACRQCAVKQFRDEKDTRGRIVMACMTPAGDGTRISINDPEAVQFRASVIEWLMINHPHDCPVCDEGGECHLQDMTVMTGHTYREYRFRKRTHRNQYLGPFLNHEMNRCIQCYRCVRYYRDCAWGRDFNVFACHDHVYFGRCREGVLESEFSGNLVEICPTGVFTDKTFKEHYTRKWDLQTAPSVCVHCSLGCNTIPGSRYGELRRVRNRYNHYVNGYFLCDRGRYGYEFVNSNRRIREPLVRASMGSEHRTSRDNTSPGSVNTSAPSFRRKPESSARGGLWVPAFAGMTENSDEAILEHPASIVSAEDALRLAAPFLTDGSKVIGIGSPRASLEANFALRTMVGPENFYAGVSDKDFDLLGLALDVLRDGAVRAPSLSGVMEADVAFVLGEDVTNTAPMLAFSLRQLTLRRAARIVSRVKIPQWNNAPILEVAQYEKESLYIATPSGTRLDDAAIRTFHAHPEDLARIGFAVASLLDPASLPVKNLSDEEWAFADETARCFKTAARPIIVSGTGCRSRAVLEAAAKIARTLRKGGQPAEICLALPESNSMGLAMLEPAGGIDAAAEALRNGGADTLIVLENDLYRRAPAGMVTGLLDSAKHVIAIDYLLHATTSKADVVLPAATFAESSGSLVNNEGRAQRFYSVFPPEGDVKESWRWMCDLMQATGRPEADRWRILDDVVEAIATAVPALSALASVAPSADYRRAGGKVPRQSHRYSGRTAIRAQIDIHEPKTPEDPDTPLSFSMEGDRRQPPSALIPRFWAPGWNSVQSLNKFQEEIGGLLRGGAPGLRLIEPRPQAQAPSFGNIPPRWKPGEGQWLVVPLHHIFGSEELSVLSPAIAELSPQPYVALHPEDASALGMADGDRARVTLGGSVLDCRVKVVPSLPRKVAGLPVGLPGEPFLDLPASGTISKGGSDG